MKCINSGAQKDIPPHRAIHRREWGQNAGSKFACYSQAQRAITDFEKLCIFCALAISGRLRAMCPGRGKLGVCVKSQDEVAIGMAGHPGIGADLSLRVANVTRVSEFNRHSERWLIAKEIWRRNAILWAGLSAD